MNPVHPSSLAKELIALTNEGINQLALAIEPGAVQRLVQFVELLGKWNRTYNLTAIRDPHEMVSHHVLDTLAVLASLDAALTTTPTPHVLDVGAGGGVPGLILAIVRPRWQITLLDAVAKKIAFVTQAVIELKLHNAHALHHRIETYVPVTPYDLIVSRAFSALAPFVSTSRQALAPHGVWAAMKGERPDSELAELPADIVVRDIVPISVPGLAGAERHLIFLECHHD